MDKRNQITIALIGPVSSGKTTLLNTLFVEQYANMKIKRTTMMPQIYHETDNINQYLNKDEIKSKNEQNDKYFIEQTENGNILTFEELKELEYYVPQVFDLVKLNKDVYLTIYDIPGLNDSRTKDIYYKYISDNFYKFDIIIFMIDINSALNTSDEIEILKLILNNTKIVNEKYNKFIELVTILNKCDNMYINGQNNLQLEDEFQEMYLQAAKTIQSSINEIYPKLCHYILPISCEDAYIYRIFNRNPDINLEPKYLNKFGMNEFGKSKWNQMKKVDKKKSIKKIMDSCEYSDRMKLSGFSTFKNKLQTILNPSNQLKFLLNDVKYKLILIMEKKYENFEIFAILTEIKEQFYRMKELINLFNIESEIKKEILVIYSKYILAFIEKIDIILKVHNCQIQNTAEVSMYENIKKAFEYAQDNLPELESNNSIYNNYIIKLTNSLNNYIELDILKPNNNLSDIGKYVSILFRNSY